MSDSENPNQSVDNAKKVAGNLLTTAMEIKQSNPKVFFGGIAGVVVLLLILMSMGGGPEPVVPTTTLKNHVVGQNYVLRGANSFDANGKIRIVQVPGSVAAFDDSEEDPKDQNQACNHLPAETQVKAIGLQDFAGKKDAFVKIKVLSAGKCIDKEGWALAIDVQ